ncbi:MAG: Nramp family divalent metal transporter [Chitinophagaceae bacterium]
MSQNSNFSLSEINASIHVPKSDNFCKNLFAFLGPGLMVAVGYMDPGNWATDIAGGSKFAYTLLSVILISNFFAMILQHLSLKLGIVYEQDLAQACQAHYSKYTNYTLWILAEIAIIACDMAEVIGAAIALKLLFNIPLAWGILFTGLDVLLILYLQGKNFRRLELFVIASIVIILLCFTYEIILSNPDFKEIIINLIPQKEIITNPAMLYIAIAILGATVMPHNLYLHSSIVQTRNYPRSLLGKKKAIKYATWDSNISLGFAFFINASILIVAAGIFYKNGHYEVEAIEKAYELLAPIIGSVWASKVFGIALLASGINATLTGTLAGQIIMEGFLKIHLCPWLRRLITRLLAIVPALVVLLIWKDKGIENLLILSQVILSMQLSFAVFPLLLFTSNKKRMRHFTNSKLLTLSGWVIGGIIALLNTILLYQTLF